LVIVFFVVLDKAPTVDIYNIAFALSSQKVESTYSLAKISSNPTGHDSFLLREACNITYFFAMGVTSNQTVYHGRLSSLGVAVIRPDCVCFDVLCIIDHHELLIYITTSWL
jgi:hypothetical protein